MIRLLFLLVWLAVPAAANPFAADGPGPTMPRASVVISESGASPLGQIGQTIARWQGQLHQAIADQVLRIQQGEGLEGILLLCLTGFAYGVFHAAAPGHGKVIVGAWFLGRPAGWHDGLLAAAVLAVGHTLSAATLVALLAWGLDRPRLQVVQDSVWLELLAYGLVALVGVLLLWRALRGEDGCAQCAAGHHHDHIHDHSAPVTAARPALNPRDMLLLFGTASLAPCSGAIILLLFTWGAGLLWLGWLASLMIALGMFLTLAAIGLMAIALRRNLAERPAAWAGPLRRGLQIGGALLIMLVASLLAWGSWLRLDV